MSHRVDYEAVASRYDRNEIRNQIPPDDEIAALPRGSVVLDLACGTGTNLAAQMNAYAEHALKWHGLDASEAMLAVARGKAPGAELVRGVAEALPYADATFDYVVTRFAFHHFEDKAKALAEMRRVLKPGGVLKIANFAPELSGDWWLYRFFPEAVEIDERRFWSLGAQEQELERLGFAVDVEAWDHGEFPASLALKEMRNRETSELVLMDDASYERGKARMESAMTEDETIESGLTLVEIVARDTRTASR